MGTRARTYNEQLTAPFSFLDVSQLKRPAIDKNENVPTAIGQGAVYMCDATDTGSQGLLKL